jgi:hypothetical protein
VLCKRHNEALSPLDTWVRRFLEAIDLWRVHLPSGAPGDFHRLFNGYDLERWMLKTLCGVSACSNCPTNELTTKWNPPRAWLKILFEGAPFPFRCGLYALRTRPSRRNEERSIYVRPVWGKWARFDRDGLALISLESDRVLVGVEVTLLGFHVALYMEPVHPDPTDPDQISLTPKSILYRPRQHRYLESETSNRLSAIHFGWEDAPPTVAGKTYAGYKTYERLDLTAATGKQRLDVAPRRKNVSDRGRERLDVGE